jgi:hypothetical protein
MNDSTITDTSPGTTDAAASATPALRRRRQRAVTLVAAVAAGLVVWAVSVPLLGLDLIVGLPPASMTITPLMVGVAALVPGALAWALLAVFERFFRRGRLMWLVVGWAVLALSLTGPSSMGASGTTLVSLITMHLAVGITLIIGLNRPRTNGRRN